MESEHQNLMQRLATITLEESALVCLMDQRERFCSSLPLAALFPPFPRISPALLRIRQAETDVLVQSAIASKGDVTRHELN